MSKTQQVQDKNIKRNIPTTVPNGIRTMVGDDLFILDFLDNFQENNCLASMALTTRMVESLAKSLNKYLEEKKNVE